MDNHCNQIYDFYKDPEINLQQEIVDEFYEILQTQSDINQRDDSYTILMNLAWAGRLDLIKLAINLGADVNVVSSDNSFALHEAAREGWQEVYNYLAPLTSPELVEIAAGVLPKGIIYRQRKNNLAVEAFVYAASIGNNNFVLNIVSQGIDINTISSNGEAALHKAIKNNHLSTVNILLEAGANPNLKIEKDWEYSPLMIALSKREIDYAIFQALLEAGSNINATSSKGETVLMFAVLTLNLEVGLKAVKQLLKLGINVNAKDINGYNALYYAKEMRKSVLPEKKEPSEIIQLLKSCGATEN